MITFRIDGRLVSVNDKKEAISACFASMDNLNYWSYDALKDLYKGTMKFFADNYDQDYASMKGKDKAAFTRFKNWVDNTLQYLPKDRDKLLALIYDTILAGEKLRRLFGFGFSNIFGDHLPGNSETKRVSKENKE